MADKTALKNRVCEVIDRREKQIVDLGEAIMDDPELGFKEERTSGKVKNATKAIVIRHIVRKESPLLFTIFVVLDFYVF